MKQRDTLLRIKDNAIEMLKKPDSHKRYLIFLYI